MSAPTDTERMTVVFDRKGPIGALCGPITIRTSAAHYAQAVDYALDECVDLDEEDYAEAPEEMDFDLELAKDRFIEDECSAARVYAGWPPEGSDDVSGLTMIHEE